MSFDRLASPRPLAVRVAEPARPAPVFAVLGFVAAAAEVVAAGVIPAARAVVAADPAAIVFAVVEVIAPRLF
jgi:hypothetical protein